MKAPIVNRLCAVFTDLDVKSNQLVTYNQLVAYKIHR